MSDQHYLLWSPCYQKVRGLPGGALPKKKQTAYLRAKAGMIILAMPPVETECIWQKQYFESIVKLWFRDHLPSSYR